MNGRDRQNRKARRIESRGGDAVERTREADLLGEFAEGCVGLHRDVGARLGLREDELLPQAAERHVRLLWQEEAVLHAGGHACMAAP